MITVFVLFNNSLVYATNYQDVRITQILLGPNYGSSVIIQLDIPPTISGCQTSTEYNFAFNGATANGKMYLSTIMTAYMTQKLIQIAGYGTGVCAEVSNVEDLYYVILQ